MKIAITRADGGVSILELTSEAESAEAEVAKWSEIHPGEYISHTTVVDLPKDRGQREAWVSRNGRIEVKVR